MQNELSNQSYIDTDEIILHIFLNIPNDEHNLKQINKQWKDVINTYNLNYTSWIKPENKKKLRILSGKIEVFNQPK